MRKLAFILLVPGLLLGNSSNEHGIWVKTDGSEVTAPCPSAFDIEGRMRLPRGCEAPSHGVLLATDRYVTLEGDLAEKDEEIEGLKRVSEAQKQRIANLEIQLSLKVVDCSQCSCQKIQTFSYGATIGALAATSACLYLHTTGE